MWNWHKSILVSLVIVIALTLSSCVNLPIDIDAFLDNELSEPLNEDIFGKLTVHYIDVGQAESILIQQGEHSMLIDAGNPNDSQTVMDYLEAQNVTTLEYVIGTHPHNDHIGGMDKIVKLFDIENIIMPKATNTTRAFERLITEIQNKELKITSPKVGEKFALGDAEFVILAPNNEKYENLNNYSVVIKLQFGQTKFLFTGDAEALSEKEILDTEVDISVDVLNVGHHGSHTSTSEEFLQEVNPSIAVISCGIDNNYGHPHKETLALLESNSIQTLRTDELGTIVISSDGNKLETLY